MAGSTSSDPHVCLHARPHARLPHVCSACASLSGGPWGGWGSLREGACSHGGHGASLSVGSCSVLGTRKGALQAESGDRVAARATVLELRFSALEEARVSLGTGAR